MNMTPEEREKLLANLPPQRRENLEKRLNRLDQLPPEQKAELDRRFEEFQKLLPSPTSCSRRIADSERSETG